MILEMGFLIKQDHMGRMLAQCMQRPGIDPWLHILLSRTFWYLFNLISDFGVSDLESGRKSAF